MARQLDILALEPFFGGARQAMLHTLVHNSRHRWTVLKLPPRRIERRLAAAAQWFAEQLSRHWVGPVDLLFTSEAMNLSELFRLSPPLAGKPTVVYFHENQLPEPGTPDLGPLALVNLNTAMAATEIWFNSAFHQRSFLRKAGGLVQQQEEIASLSPIDQLTTKSIHVPPPIDMTLAHEITQAQPVTRDQHAIFVDTRGAELEMLNVALGFLSRRNLKCRLLTVGPVEGLDPSLPRRTVSERDEAGQIAALYEAGVHVSARLHAPLDLHAVRALHLGCWPVYPRSGFYPELLPATLQPSCLYAPSGAELAGRLLNLYTMERPRDYEAELSRILSPFDAMSACRTIDHRLEQLAGG